MAYLGDSRATDERDRVYSLLGAAKEAHLVKQLDLSWTVEEVYKALVKSFIQEYDSLDIICYSHVFNSSARREDNRRTLPSWVPDWRVHVEGKAMTVMASQGSKEGTGNFRPAAVMESKAMYKASGEKLPACKISEDLLITSGINVDRIDGLGVSTHNDAGRIINSRYKLLLEQPTSRYNSQLDQSRSSTSTLIETISRCLALDRPDRYLAEYMSPNLFLDDFLKLCKSYFSDPRKENPPRYFREWFDGNKALRIQGRSLEERCQEASLHTPLIGWRDLTRGSPKQFHTRIQDTVVNMARRLVVTDKGYLGMAASRARKGDLVCVLYGCSIPVLLREVAGGRFEFIGECYLDGFMDGEAIKKGLGEVQFRIV